MKTSERFDRAIAALVKGYMNNTLAKGTCTACAVGNMVAHSLNYQIKRVEDECTDEIDFDFFDEDGELVLPSWRYVFMTMQLKGKRSRKNRQTLDMRHYYGLSKKEIDATGYTVSELMDIEWAFEKATRIRHDEYHRKREKSIDRDQLNGLFAVVDVLCKLEGYDTTVAEEKKALFVKCDLV